MLVDRQCNGGISPPFVACERGHLEVVLTLMSAGAQVNLTAADGTSSLYVACKNGHLDVVRTLLSAGVLVDLVRDGDSSAL